MPRGFMVLAGAALMLAACTSASPASPPTPITAPAAPISPAPSTAAVVVDGPGWDAGGLQGAVPSPGTCHIRRAGDGQSLPDRTCTPGATDSRVTQSDLATTICRAGGYSESVRPPESMTEAFKARDLAAYGESGPISVYELDHLVPIGLGGASDTANLWPEPDDHPAGPDGPANSKDVVETKLHDLVCAAVRGEPYVPLATAQALISSDWTTALSRAAVATVG